MAQTGTTNDFDSGLLSRDEEDGAAGELRERKRSSFAEATEDKGGEEGAGGESKSLRQRVQAARQAMNLKAMAKAKLAAKVTAPAKAGTSRLLKAAWLNIIDSIGLTLIWINIHVFLHWVLGDKLFCKLGEEWLPQQAMQSNKEAGEMAGKAIGLVETIVLLTVDLIILAVIFGALALIVMIVNFMGKSWWGQLGDLWDAFWGIGWGGVQALVDLFGKK